MKVSVILGTRPEAIKLAPVILALRNDRRFQCEVCVTAQHRQMLDQILTIFEIVPDADLDLMQPNQTLPELTARALTGVSNYLRRSKPDMVLVQGDTTTVFAASMAAFYQDVPVGHVEAGLRTLNIKSPWPEEANRVLTSRLAEMHFAPTQTSRQNLLNEGIPDNSIFLTGNTVIDALHIAMRRVRALRPEIPGISEELMNATNRRLVLITGHRRENFGGKLGAICMAIDRLARRFPDVEFVYPMHLNPNVRATVRRVLGNTTATGPVSNIHLIEPLSYLPFIALMERSTIVLTDSGGIQEEAPALGKPVLVTRDTTERPEALATGTVRLVGSDQERIVDEVSVLLSDSMHYARMARVLTPYGDGTAAAKILDAIAGRFTDGEIERINSEYVVHDMSRGNVRSAANASATRNS
jgi:UDP-N-acetylglucosamine 2-epimerase (non-hydrolysing)